MADGPSFQQAVSESRAAMRRGYGEPQPGSGAEEASARLEQAGRLREREAAQEEQSGVLSPRSAALNMALGYAKSDARRAGVQVADDEPDDDGRSAGDSLGDLAQPRPDPPMPDWRNPTDDDPGGDR